MKKIYHVPWVQYDNVDRDFISIPSIIQVEASSPAQALSKAKGAILEELLYEYIAYRNKSRGDSFYFPGNCRLPREEKPAFFYWGELKFKNDEDDDFSYIYLGESVELPKLQK